MMKRLYYHAGWMASSIAVLAMVLAIIAMSPKKAEGGWWWIVGGAVVILAGEGGTYHYADNYRPYNFVTCLTSASPPPRIRPTGCVSPSLRCGGLNNVCTNLRSDICNCGDGRAPVTNPD